MNDDVISIPVVGEGLDATMGTDFRYNDQMESTTSNGFF
jgi:hypothetical protein